MAMLSGFRDFWLEYGDKLRPITLKFPTSCRGCGCKLEKTAYGTKVPVRWAFVCGACYDTAMRMAPGGTASDGDKKPKSKPMRSDAPELSEDFVAAINDIASGVSNMTGFDENPTPTPAPELKAVQTAVLLRVISDKAEWR